MASSRGVRRRSPRKSCAVSDVANGLASAEGKGVPPQRERRPPQEAPRSASADPVTTGELNSSGSVSMPTVCGLASSCRNQGMNTSTAAPAPTVLPRTRWQPMQKFSQKPVVQVPQFNRRHSFGSRADAGLAHQSTRGSNLIRVGGMKGLVGCDFSDDTVFSDHAGVAASTHATISNASTNGDVFGGCSDNGLGAVKMAQRTHSNSIASETPSLTDPTFFDNSAFTDAAVGFPFTRSAAGKHVDNNVEGMSSLDNNCDQKGQTAKALWGGISRDVEGVNKITVAFEDNINSPKLNVSLNSAVSPEDDAESVETFMSTSTKLVGADSVDGQDESLISYPLLGSETKADGTKVTEASASVSDRTCADVAQLEVMQNELLELLETWSDQTRLLVQEASQRRHQEQTKRSHCLESQEAGGRESSQRRASSLTPRHREGNDERGSSGKHAVRSARGRSKTEGEVPAMPAATSTSPHGSMYTPGMGRVLGRPPPFQAWQGPQLRRSWTARSPSAYTISPTTAVRHSAHASFDVCTVTGRPPPPSCSSYKVQAVQAVPSTTRPLSPQTTSPRTSSPRTMNSSLVAFTCANAGGSTRIAACSSVSPVGHPRTLNSSWSLPQLQTLSSGVQQLLPAQLSKAPSMTTLRTSSPRSSSPAAVGRPVAVSPRKVVWSTRGGTCGSGDGGYDGGVCGVGGAITTVGDVSSSNFQAAPIPSVSLQAWKTVQSQLIPAAPPTGRVTPFPVSSQVFTGDVATCNWVVPSWSSVTASSTAAMSWRCS
eukprot:TRINITY_DN29512_c0_g2_i1.p1 TRINITY_DN29512_c0_g2~~TRINITY_DN29512_c0_g2_i1.p1  ORF type:complete len:770 (-),score=88.01 TRINITY_DN29512_c0_g2_i1:84-2393(-)